MNKTWSPSLGAYVETETLGPQIKPPKQKRTRRRARSIRRGRVWLPRNKMFELIKVTKGRTGPALLCLLILDFLVYEAKNNCVKFTNDLVRECGFDRETKRIGLPPLQTIGIIQIEKTSDTASPWVTHLWYDQNGKFIGDQLSG